MRDILRADIYRIWGKRLQWILLALSYVCITVMIAVEIDESPDRAFFFVKRISDGFSLISLVAGFAMLLGVYGDEFKSMVMIGVIGQGKSRTKFVVSKFLDVMILGAQMYIMSGIFVAILSKAFGVVFTGSELKFIWISISFDYLNTLAFVSLASVFYFLSENAAVGLFAFIAFETIIPLTLYFLESMTSLYQYHVSEYYMDGLLASACSDYIIGDNFRGTFFLLMGIVIYILCSVLLSIQIFRRKELNF